jgi:hypothetical protein
VDDYNALADLFYSIGHFLHHLEIYTEIPPTVSMNEIIIKILVELLSTLASTTQGLRQGKLRESVVVEGDYCLIREMQKTSLRSFLARRKWRRWSKGWTDSRKMRLG